MKTEEKARAYDEALKRAKAAIDIAADKDLVGGVVRTVFPELAESEDERIGNVIYCIVRDNKEVKRILEGNGVSVDNALAYLEKQKENKFAPQVLPCSAAWFEDDDEKQKEQKPVEINEYEIIKKHITDDSLSSEVNKRLKECGWYVTDEKPAEWGEDYNEEDIQTRFAFYTYKDDLCTLYLSNVFVEETSRNKGFGKKILTAAEKVAETFGVTYIRLKVKQGSSANAWYRKNGYGYVAFEDGYDWLEKNLEYMNPNKQEWDEFDEDCLKRAVWYIENPATSVVKDTNLALWLKSLPGRFNLQPKQEWGDKDETAFSDLMWCIKQAAKFAKDENDMGNIWFAENWVKNRLKFLRPQPKQEWSKEDEEMYARVVRRYTDYEGLILSTKEESVSNKMLDAMAQEEIWLKSIHSQPQWKPTNQQMEALRLSFEEAFDGAGDCNRYRDLKSLYEQLKKLM